MTFDPNRNKNKSGQGKVSNKSYSNLNLIKPAWKIKFDNQF